MMLPTEPNTPPNSKIWRVIHFPLVLLVIGFVFVAAGNVLAAVLIRVFPPLHNNPIEMLQAAAVAAIVAAAYVAFVGLIERRPVTEFGAKGWAGELGIGLLLGVALFSVVIGIIALLGGYRVIGYGPVEVVYPAVAMSIFSGVGEEIVLRGLFFRLIERWLGSWIALALSAALFGALHLGNPNATLFAGIAIALEAGVMLAALYMVTRRLWAAIGLHAAWNFAQGGIYGVAVSGFDQKGLLRPAMRGPEWLTGGAFGAEASLVALIVNVAFGIALLVIAYRRGKVVAPFWARRRAYGAGVQE